MKKFRIYGDNIVECERAAGIILRKLGSLSQSAALANLSTLIYSTDYEGEKVVIELLPGFNKSGQKRWDKNIFDALKQAGSILDETPDVIITRIVDCEEEILLAIEFCSALQAGNQAWQRSGRAFSVGRTGCPYIYVVDFVKYELDSKTRKRKAFRFPNPLVPYSYWLFSKRPGILTIQSYARSEEFRPEGKLKDFPEQAFALDTVAAYIIAKMFGENCILLENLLLEKNKAVVDFLTHSQPIHIPDPSLSFKKKIAKKSLSGHTTEIKSLGENYGVGVSREFPFGVIPASERPEFTEALSCLYPGIGENMIEGLSQTSQNLIFCIIKGFKPGGDDNRPDRGVLPLAAMLFPSNEEILTFIYGPLLRNSYQDLQNYKEALSDRSGFWNVILSLSDFIIVDSPLIGKAKDRAEIFIDNRNFKSDALITSHPSKLVFPTFEAQPLSYREDDVDTVLHYLFSHVFREKCFESLCNPPGGDWSGISLLVSAGVEIRWLSLPRESGTAKRPDHVIEIFRHGEKPILLIIESKENSRNLEEKVGVKLINYVKNLMSFMPNVEKRDGEWHKCKTPVSENDFVIISGAAYLKHCATKPELVFVNTDCDILFVIDPLQNNWNLKIYVNPDSDNGHLVNELLFAGRSEIEI